MEKISQEEIQDKIFWDKVQEHNRLRKLEEEEREKERERTNKSIELEECSDMVKNEEERVLNFLMYEYQVKMSQAYIYEELENP